MIFLNLFFFSFDLINADQSSTQRSFTRMMEWPEGCLLLPPPPPRASMSPPWTAWSTWTPSSRSPCLWGSPSPRRGSAAWRAVRRATPAPTWPRSSSSSKWCRLASSFGPRWWRRGSSWRSTCSTARTQTRPSGPTSTWRPWGWACWAPPLGPSWAASSWCCQWSTSSRSASVCSPAVAKPPCTPSPPWSSWSLQLSCFISPLLSMPSLTETIKICHLCFIWNGSFLMCSLESVMGWASRDWGEIFYCVFSLYMFSKQKKERNIYWQFILSALCLIISVVRNLFQWDPNEKCLGYSLLGWCTIWLGCIL